MKPAVVSDTSPLNYLVLIDAVEILPRLFSEILVPPAVVSELSQPGTPEKVRRWLEHAPAWLVPKTPRDTTSVTGLDAGETEAIALAEELGIDSLLIDERNGWRVAANRGLIVLGTLAVIETAAQNGWINFDEHIRRLRTTPFRMHERLIEQARSRLSQKALDN